MATKLQPRAVAMQTASATGNQIENILGGLVKGLAEGTPEIKNPQTGDVIRAGLTAAQLRQGFVDAFGEEGLAKYEKAAAIFADDGDEEKPAPVKGAKPARK